MTAGIRSILILLLMMLQLASASLTSSAVLCIGSDGHLALETAHDQCTPTTSCCCDESHPVSDSPSLIAAQACNDLSLPASSTQLTLRDLQPALQGHPALARPIATGQLLPVLEPVSLPTWTIACDSFMRDAPAHRTLHLLNHRSVTLLI